MTPSPQMCLTMLAATRTGTCHLTRRPLRHHWRRPALRVDFPRRTQPSPTGELRTRRTVWPTQRPRRTCATMFSCRKRSAPSRHLDCPRTSGHIPTGVSNLFAVISTSVHVTRRGLIPGIADNLIVVQRCVSVNGKPGPTEIFISVFAFWKKILYAG